MKIRNLFLSDYHTFRTLWRILIFTSALLISVTPLLLVHSALLQFSGAVLILILGLYLNAKYLDKIDFSAYGIVLSKVTFISLFIGTLIGAISVVIMLLLGSATDNITFYKHSATLNSKLFLLFALKMFLVGALEETFFRGYLFTTIYSGHRSRYISKRQALTTGLIISSLLFGLAHFNTSNATLGSTLLLSINGLVWCIPFILTKNLGLSIGMHMAWNFTQTLLGFTMSGNKSYQSLYIVENKGSDYLTGGTYGPEAGILGLIGLMAMLLLSILYIRLFTKEQ